MKILVIAKWMVKWNGASRVSYELSKRFKKEHEVRIVAYKDHIDPEWEKEFEIYKLQHKGLFALKEIRKVIKEYKPDIIHSHDWLGLLALFSNTPHVATSHEHWPMNWFFSSRTFVGGIIQAIPNEIKVHLADKVVSVSKYCQQVLKKRGIKSVVIHNGIAEEFLNPPKNQLELEHPSILFVGNIHNEKAKYLVPFIDLLNQKSGKVHTYVIGAPVDKKIVERLKNLDNTHYLGVVDDVKPYYQEADVLISTSKIEMFGLVPVEAQACGLPVVAFNICSFPEIIKDGETGFLVKMGDLDEMVNKTLNILMNEDLREEMGRNGIENIKENFLWDDKAESYIKLFSERMR
ncbi:MAG: glycosyltransferase family 4 protein [Halobacteriota archaeon]